MKEVQKLAQKLSNFSLARWEKVRRLQRLNLRVTRNKTGCASGDMEECSSLDATTQLVESDREEEDKVSESLSQCRTRPHRNKRPPKMLTLLWHYWVDPRCHKSSVQIMDCSPILHFDWKRYFSSEDFVENFKSWSNGLCTYINPAIIARDRIPCLLTYDRIYGGWAETVLVR